MKSTPSLATARRRPVRVRYGHRLATPDVALGHHLRLRLEEDRIIAPTRLQRLRLARAILSRGREFGLLAFAAAGTHLHLELLCSADRAWELARRLKMVLTLQLSLPVAFERTRLKPIMDVYHLENTFTYILDQADHHKLQFKSVFEASNLPDLLGLRPLGAYTLASMREHLPRTPGRVLLAPLGLAEMPSAVDSIGPLEPATLFAAALPTLAGNHLERCLARCAAVQVGLKHARSSEVAQRLGVTSRAVRRLADRPVPGSLLTAVERQLALRQARPDLWEEADVADDWGPGPWHSADP